MNGRPPAQYPAGTERAGSIYSTIIDERAKRVESLETEIKLLREKLDASQSEARGTSRYNRVLGQRMEFCESRVATIENTAWQWEAVAHQCWYAGYQAGWYAGSGSGDEGRQSSDGADHQRYVASAHATDQQATTTRSYRHDPYGYQSIDASLQQRVGQVHIAQPYVNVSTIPRLASNSWQADERPQRNALPGGDGSIGARTAPVREGADGDHESATDANEEAGVLPRRSESNGSPSPQTADGAVTQGTNQTFGGQADNARSEDSDPSRVEDSVKVGRSTALDEGEYRTQHTDGSDHRLGARNEDDTAGPVPSSEVHGDRRRLDGRDPSWTEDERRFRNADGGDDGADSEEHQAGVRQGIRSPLHQTRSNDTTGVSRSTGRVEDGSAGNHRKAQEQDGNLPSNGKVPPRPHRSSEDAGDAGGDEVAMKRGKLFNMHYKRKQYATREDAGLRLHMGSVGRVSYDAIAELASENVERAERKKEEAENLRNEFYRMRQFAESEAPYKAATKGKAREVIPTRAEGLFNKEQKREKGLDEDDDIELMLKSGNFKQVSEIPKRMGVVFTRAEPKKSRRRQLYWPKQLNDEIRNHFGKQPIDLEDTVLHAANVQPGMYARCFDIEKSFLQMGLSSGVQKYHGFKYRGKFYVNCTAPMGEVWVPAFVHLILKILAFNEEEVHTEMHIDNVRFLGKEPRDVDRASERFIRNCKRCNVTLNNEATNQIHRVGDFLGTTNDYENGCVKMAAKTVEKLKTEAKIAMGQDATIEDFRALFGVLFFASRVLRLSLAEYYGPVKFLRRRLHEVSKGLKKDGDKATLWPCMRNDLQRWIEQALSNPWTNHVERREGIELVLVTDASTTGWGAVLYDERNGKAAATGGKWKNKHTSSEINELEAQSVRNAAEAFEEQLRDPGLNHLLLLVDNTATMHAYRKGSAQAYLLNRAVREGQRYLPERVKVSIAYIDSKTNQSFADPISRGEKMKEELASQLGELGRRLGRTALHVAVPTSHRVSFPCRRLNQVSSAG